MQAILAGDYSFKPEEYWHNVSKTARDFVNQCLTVDPKRRMRVQEALSHRWIAEMKSRAGEDLLPVIKKNFNARRTLHAAIDTIRAINQLRGGAGTPMTVDQMKQQQQQQHGNNNDHKDHQQNGHHNGHGDANGEQDQLQQHHELDSRSNARGQTDDMIKEQQRRIFETQQKMWRR